MEPLSFVELATICATAMHMVAAAITALMLGLTKMRVSLDERLDLLIQTNEQTNVLDAVPRHLFLRRSLTIHYVCPETEAFVLYLTTDLKKRPDISESIHVEPKALDSLNDVNAWHGWGRSKARQEDFTSDLWQVVLITIVGNYSVSFF
jgi:hypothetical protein